MMKRSQLKTKANKFRRPENMINYKKQRNYVTNLNKAKKRTFFFETSNEPHQKSFWKACNSVFPGKWNKHQDRLNLEIENDIMSDKILIADILNDYFVNIAKILPIDKMDTKFV